MLIALAVIASFLCIAGLAFVFGWAIANGVIVDDDAYWSPEREALADLEFIHDPTVPRSQRRAVWRNLWRAD